VSTTLLENIDQPTPDPTEPAPQPPAARGARPSSPEGGSARSRPPAAAVLDLDTLLTVVRWDDPRANAHWHELRGEYVERFWLGVLGPATTLLLRRFARGFVERPDGFRVSPADTAGALGMGRGTGRHSMISRTVERACQFGAAFVVDEHTLAVRSLLPPLTSRQLSRLPAKLQRAHGAWLERHAVESDGVSRPSPH
jgi:hypothetical protein